MTPRQERFCQEYLMDLNATAAAKRAGFSLDSANEYAAELMSKDWIRERIGQLLEERSLRVGVTQDFVLQELVAMVRTETGNPKVRAIELLGKHLNMFKEKIDVNLELAREAEKLAALTPEQQIEMLRDELRKLELQHGGRK